MNQYLYTFSGGNLWRHNTNEVRNSFYGEASADSTVTSVFNAEPMMNKLFKTIAYEGDHAWKAELVTELQTPGVIEAAFFEQKESDWFAFIRNSVDPGTTDDDFSNYDLRSVNGIGNSLTTVTGGATTTINFPLTTSIGTMITGGDAIYYAAPDATPGATITPVFVGTVQSINVDLPNGINNLVVNGTVVVPDVSFILYVKNQVAESHGVLGHYCVFTLTNSDTEAVELFAVKSEAMKSFP
tara:strand:- start:3330 stop:4052 length:723 start_codon:yes stop_codon:yes gene_type:complete